MQKKATKKHSIPQLVRIGTVAKLLDRHPDTIREMCAAGTMPHYRLPSKTGQRDAYAFDEAEVAEWLAAYKVA